jgi:4-alpha-glucanotransferase
MTAVAPSGALLELAGLYGALPKFEDVASQEHHASPEALTKVLRALGAPIDSPGEAETAVREERDRLGKRVLEPVIVCNQSDSGTVLVRLPQQVPAASCWATLTLEDGAVRRARPNLVPERDATGGSSLVAYRFSLVDITGMALPLGYHHLRVEGSAVDAEAQIIVAPTCPTPDRGWGAFQPLHALRSESDWGVGNYHDLAELTAWVEGLGGSFVGTLPLYPTFLEGPVEVSPYLPVTRLGWSEIFIDPTRVPELAQSPEAANIVESRCPESLESIMAVDYPEVMARMRRVLEPLAEALYTSDSRRRQELDGFVSAHPELIRYAQFRSAREQGSSVSEETGSVQGLDWRSRYHLYVQWVAAQQIEAAGERLYLDMPIGVHPDGFDPWWRPEAFAKGVEGGAPPDAFFASGQTWGFRPLHPRAMVEEGFGYPIACLRHVMARAAVVRIDHVMGLQRLFWVPSGFDATDGVYVNYPLQEMKSIVALEAYRSGTAVVGEDLGTVPDEVRTAMEESRMLRTWVLQFAVTESEPLPAPTEMAMASLGTHDLPRFATFLDGEDIDDLVGRGAQDESWARPERQQRQAWRQSFDALGGAAGSATTPSHEFQRAILHLASSGAQLVSVDLEDIWQERIPVNRPGSGPEARNWQARSQLSLRDMQKDAVVNATLEMIDSARRAADPKFLQPTERQPVTGKGVSKQ